jgi:chemotaxis protein histidine kinase CheA
VQPGTTTTSTTAAPAPAPAGAPQGTAQAGAQSQGQTQPPAPAQTQQANQPAPALSPQQAQQQKQQLTTNLTQLKNINPAINIPGTANAVTKDPTKLTPTDAQNLDKVANTIKPAMLDRNSLSQLKSMLNRLNNRPQGPQ